MSYRVRIALLMLLDSVIVSTAIFLAVWIVTPALGTQIELGVIVVTAIALLIFHHLFSSIYKLYNKVWAYASIGELIAIAKAVTFSIIAAGIVQFFINGFVLYDRALLVTWLLHIILIGGSRFGWRMIRNQFIKQDAGKKRTLLVGAGAAGSMIARQLKHEHENTELQPVAFVDDDPAKQKMQLYGLPVIGTVASLPGVVKAMNIEHIVISIPSLRNNELNQIVEVCSQTGLQVKMIPKIEDLMTGKISVSHLRNIEVEDLLDRDPVKLDIDSISEDMTGNTVLVTGAGGSIGSEICRQVMRFHPGKIVLVGHGEFSIYSIDMELRNEYKETDIEIVPVIADVQDRHRIFEVVQHHEPSVIYHAAAHKHVPLMEQNPHDAVKNNVIGTKNVAEAAETFGVRTFVMVSTDKAVNPTNVMGATKRIAEMIVQQMAKQSETRFTAVRFGNVLGSRGSVIPLFKKQIVKGGPVTVTHPEMTRYFMTIPEASRLVIQAGALAKGGEIFVLDMGEPVKIADLAKKLINLSGYGEEEIPIIYTGIRPGEKMYEELLGKDEILPGEVYEKIYVGQTVSVDQHMIFDLIDRFEHDSPEQLKETLMAIVYMDKTPIVQKA